MFAYRAKRRKEMEALTLVCLAGLILNHVYEDVDRRFGVKLDLAIAVIR